MARAAHGDAGVLLTTGNYAGDVMNFGLAVTQLRSEGIDARVLRGHRRRRQRAKRARRPRRRGIAGDFTVFKCASAAAEDGLDLAGRRARRRGVQRRHPDARRRVRRLHAARRRPPAVHRARRADGPRPRHPRRAGGAPTSRCRRPPTWRHTLVDGVLGDQPDAELEADRGDPQRTRPHQVRGAVRRVGHGRRGCCANAATSSSNPRSANWSPASTWPAAR